MPDTVEQFVKHLEDSGIVGSDTLQDFLPPKADPQDAEELARELVRNNKLTEFQAAEVSKGNAKSLVLGNYVLMEKIGAGGMGQVFKAEHRRMHRIVAVKVLPVETMKDPATIARFEREVTAAARINHPNLVTAYDADQADGVHFLVMEFVDGSNLSSLVKKHGPLTVDQAVNCILQAAKGLDAAHAEGVVHRDIKPSNLLIDKKGNVKILDMGLARIDQGDGPAQAELTSTGLVMGTVDYMAPEQAVDSKSADARADIYSLGCSLHYLLTGKPPYQGDSIMNRVLAHREQPIPALRTCRSDIPEFLEAVFSKMVAKQVANRYQTVSQIIADLEQVAGSQVVLPAGEPSADTLVWSQELKPAAASFQAAPIFFDGPQHAPEIPLLPPEISDNQRIAVIGGSVLALGILLAGLLGSGFLLDRLLAAGILSAAVVNAWGSNDVNSAKPGKIPWMKIVRGGFLWLALLMAGIFFTGFFWSYDVAAIVIIITAMIRIWGGRKHAA